MRGYRCIFWKKSAKPVTLLSAAAAPGQKIRYPSEKVCEHTAKQYDNNGTGEREWPALVRQLNDLTNDYMD